MRTLKEIIDAAKSNQPVSDEEARYAICALDGLATFDQMDLMKLGATEKDGNPVRFAWIRYEESFRRWKTALNKSPKEYLGSQFDPASTEYQDRRKIANAIFKAAMEGKLPTQQEKPTI